MRLRSESLLASIAASSLCLAACAAGPQSSRTAASGTSSAPAGSAAAASSGSAPAELAAAIDPARLQATVVKLVSFGTRHTLSDAGSETRGIGAARRWLAAEFAALTRLPGSRLQPFEDAFVAPVQRRVPRAVEIVNVGAVLPAANPSRAKEAVVVTGHYDSRRSDVLDATGDSPGANDDASGTALVLEMARAFAPLKSEVAVYFVAVAGEEQGLIGSAHLAERLRSEGVRVLADITFDIVGNTQGEGGVVESGKARLYSEGVPSRENEAERKLREALGGENDSPSREWARYVKRVGETAVPDLELLVMLRRDRIARGGDHMPFLGLGTPAIRATEGRENFHRQHQDPRIDNGVAYGDDLAHFDAAYAARLGRAVGAALGSLALAPTAPAAVALGGAVTTTARLRWTLPPDPRIDGVVVYRRRADSVRWELRDRLGRVDHLDLAGIVGDDHYFAVATVDAAGNESLAQPPAKVE